MQVQQLHTFLSALLSKHFSAVEKNVHVLLFPFCQPVVNVLGIWQGDKLTKPMQSALSTAVLM